MRGPMPYVGLEKNNGNSKNKMNMHRQDVSRIWLGLYGGGIGTRMKTGDG
jgi:hypothetical protein